PARRNLYPVEIDQSLFTTDAARRHFVKIEGSIARATSDERQPIAIGRPHWREIIRRFERQSRARAAARRVIHPHVPVSGRVVLHAGRDVPLVGRQLYVTEGSRLNERTELPAGS